MAMKPFKGVIKLDVRDSKPDWSPFELEESARRARPISLIVLYDDTGLAAWSPFGGRINMPTLQKLADNGLMYSQWQHDRALLAHAFYVPHRTQSHVNRSASITEAADGFPGAAGRLPAECGHHRSSAPGQWLQHVLVGEKPPTCPSRTSRAAAANRSGRSRKASIASTDSWAANQQLVSVAGRGQPVYRPAGPA
jgi:hypothetical protein